MAEQVCTKKVRKCSTEGICLLYRRLKCLTVPQEHIYAHIYTHVVISTHIYTYIHIHTHIYTYIHTNWRNASARRNCGTVPKKEFAYLHRRLKCLTVPQEHIYAHIYTYILISTHIYTYIHIHTHINTYMRTNWRSGSARRKCGTVPQKEFAYLRRKLKCLTVPQEHIYADIYSYLYICTHTYIYIHIYTNIYLLMGETVLHEESAEPFRRRNLPICIAG